MKIKRAIKSIGTILFLALVFEWQSAWAAETYSVTPKAFGSNRFEMEMNGQPVFVHKFKDIHYAHFAHPDNGSARITLDIRRPFETANLGPKSMQIPLRVDLESRVLKFHLEEPEKVVITLDNKERLFVFAEKPANDSPDDINILEYGADASGKTLSTRAIQDAIDKAPPGTIVRIPPGHYLSGSVFLKSNLTLLLEAGALLQASSNPDEFEPIQNAFIVIQECENVKLTGFGTIDGSGAFLRHLTDESGRLLAVRDSHNVTIEDLILRNPRAWNTHIIRSEHVTLRNLKLLNDRTVSNTDGIDPDSSRHILIEETFFYCGDDAVAIKSTNRDGRFEDVYDITVRNNIILTHKSALKVGTETHASEMKNIVFRNNDVIECDRGMSIYARDGAHVHSVRFIDNRFENSYADYQQCLLHFLIQKRYGLSRISDVLIQDCLVEEPWPKSSFIKGLSDENRVTNVRFVNYRYAGRLCESPEDADLRLGPHVKEITFNTTD